MPPSNRPFSLADALVLVAATAVGLALTRATTPMIHVGYSLIVVRSVGPGVQDTTSTTIAYLNVAFPGVVSPYFPIKMLHSLKVSGMIFLATPCLAAWTLACWALQIRSRQRGRSRLVLRPGSAALGAAVLAAMANVLQGSPYAWPMFVPRPPVWDFWAWSLVTWCFLPKAAGLAVAVAWMLLWRSGRWKADPGWLDRLGRFLGGSWIVLALVSVTATWLHAFGF